MEQEAGISIISVVSRRLNRWVWVDEMGRDHSMSAETNHRRMRLMAKPVLAVSNWGLMSLGIACLGIGLWFAIGALVDLDFMNANHLKCWPSQVIMEISIALILMGLGPWCVLQGIRTSSTGR